MKKLLMLLLIYSMAILNVSGQTAAAKKIFIGYETLEMAMNKFSYFAGEFAYALDSSNQLRLMVGEVKLSEQHLSSTWQAVAVDGDNVEGYLRIYELYYDRFLGKRRNFYVSGSAAYVRDKYDHLVLDEKIDSETATIGFAWGYRKSDLFGVDGLYINASMPFRYYFNEIPETTWGETTVLIHKYVNNIWLFVGVNF